MQIGNRVTDCKRRIQEEGGKKYFVKLLSPIWWRSEETPARAYPLQEDTDKVGANRIFLF